MVSAMSQMNACKIKSSLIKRIKHKSFKICFIISDVSKDGLAKIVTNVRKDKVVNMEVVSMIHSLVFAIKVGMDRFAINQFARKFLMYICWLDSYRVPRKYKNSMQGTTFFLVLI